MPNKHRIEFIYLCGVTSLAIVVLLAPRKVRTAQGSTPVNSRMFATRIIDSATENNRLLLSG